MPRVTYLYDPLCGWCYGASAAVRDVAAQPGVSVAALPTGLFSGAGARRMDAGLAGYAWSNDQRIARLTGAAFTETYRREVLGAIGGAFDSGPATLALTAVARMDPARELEALAAVQRARYVDGRDIADTAVLGDVLRTLGLDGAADALAVPDDGLLDARRGRVAQAQRLMAGLGLSGVPALALTGGDAVRALPSGLLFGDRAALLAVFEAG
ncbi:DsbA family protein [Azospirillum sp. RWY-5-1]|uniref:DsbA family protein n=1 Tax=Azospirillum oleiclasticum TaxID=2735135 RepID=A0ABX2TFK7_9PROT|nr:DsbA family protein [Azospirillum oleiclasticum]NYZ16063.1 DsbA family protein [Azospirillum oleiclasticum]NYZ22944.1 DsbA family protein [Azospirillum oleiclasticum]